MDVKEILKQHQKWLNNEVGQQANLSEADLGGADLGRADLRGANLSEADLSEADLRGADLRGANIDFSVWPFWCGSFDVHVDIEQVRQLLYHVCRVKCDDPAFAEIITSIRDQANLATVRQRHDLMEIE